MSDAAPIDSFPALLSHLEEGRKLQKLILQNAHLQQKLLDREQTRQLRAMRETGRQRLKEMMLETLLPMIPILINKVRGKRVLPEIVHPDIEQFKLFLATVKEDEFSQLMAIFGPRLLPILELVRKYKDEYEAREESKKRQAESVTPHAE
jgi:hypothetical protein